MSWPTAMHIYRVHEDVLDATPIDEALAEFRFRPVSPREARRVGWSPPAGKRSEALSHEIQRHILITMLKQERLLPAAVVNEEVADRAEAREQAEGQPLSRSQRQLLKEQVLEELLPQAFTRTKRIDVWWDTKRRLIGINASSRKRVEEVLDLLRQTLGSLKVTPLATKTPPSRGMTQWLSDPASRPASLLLGDKVELRAAEDNGVVRAQSVDLDSEEMQSLLENGRQVTRLGIGIEGMGRFQLHDDLSIKGLQFDDALLDEASQSDDGGDPIVSFETDFALWSAALGKIIDQLIEWLGGEAEAVAPADAIRYEASTKDADPLLQKAAVFVGSEGKASISMLQRRFKIGYNRAARLIESLESAGVVSPIDNSGQRSVLATLTIGEEKP